MSDTWTCEWCGMVHRSALEYNNHTCCKQIPSVTDIVEQLRNKFMDTKKMLPCELEHEAADEIESLRQRVAELEEYARNEAERTALIDKLQHQLAACEKERDKWKDMCHYHMERASR